MVDQNQPNDAPGAGEQNPSATPATPPEGTNPSTSTPAAEPKVEVKDGVVTVDGKKYVKESDLIAAKESLQRQLNEAQQTHNEATEKLQLQVSEANQKVAQANAALEETKNARESGAASDEDVARARQEKEAAEAQVIQANDSALDYRRKYIMAVYSIHPDSEQGQKLMEKDMSQLDSFEEALKALSQNRGGPGNYAIGGGGGGPAQPSEMDRAKALLQNTPFRGVRNEPQQGQPQ